MRCIYIHMYVYQQMCMVEVEVARMEEEERLVVHALVATADGVSTLRLSACFAPLRVCLSVYVSLSLSRSFSLSLSLSISLSVPACLSI